jgi:hypothetical protein
MGKLVFQSALGGTLEMVAPNTAEAVVLTLPSISGTIIGTGDPGVITSDMISGQISVAQGGTGTATPSLVAGTNVSITGAWPNQTINSTGGGSGVTQIVAGTNVTISPEGGTGAVTINASGGNNIGGYPVSVASPQNYDALMFLNNQWANIPQTEISDGGNF